MATDSTTATPATAMKAAQRSRTATSGTASRPQDANGSRTVYSSGSFEGHRKKVERFKSRQAELALAALADTRTYDGATLTTDMYRAAAALIVNFYAAEKAEQRDVNGTVVKVISRTAVAEGLAKTELSTDPKLQTDARMAQVRTGFKLARELLGEAYSAARAEQNS